MCDLAKKYGVNLIECSLLLYVQISCQIFKFWHVENICECLLDCNLAARLVSV